MCGLEPSEWLRKKSDREQPSVRLAMCERSPLGLPHTQNRMSGRPRVAEMLLMRSPHACVFITAVPVTKLFAWGGGEDNGGHVLRETTSRGQCELAHHALMNAGERDIV